MPSSLASALQRRGDSLLTVDWYLDVERVSNPQISPTTWWPSCCVD